MARISSAREIVALAKTQVGYHEGRNNANKYSRALGRPPEYWCQDFMDWLYRQGHVAHERTAACYVAEAYWKRNGRLHTRPKVGDQFFIYFPSKRNVHHTGIVIGISKDGRTVYTIEGNSNPGGSRNGYGVVRRSRPVLARPGQTGIRSYGRPYYGPDPKAPKPRPADTTFRVKDLQKAMRVTADNDWGPVTERRIHHFREIAKRHGSVTGLSKEIIKEAQRACGVVPDGEWGPKSRAAFKRTVANIQTALRVAPDGSWGPLTESAYQAARSKNKR